MQQVAIHASDAMPLPPQDALGLGRCVSLTDGQGQAAGTITFAESN